MSRCISILGSTGSIGRQSLDVIAACGMRAAALTANRSVRELEEQARRFRPELAVLMEEDAAADLKVRLADTGVRVAAGMEGLLEAASLPGADTVLTAVVGMVGLRPTLAAIREGKRIALANKETLVCAGELIVAISVTLRYFPAIREEVGYIRDAMKLRDIRGLARLECTVMPLMVSATETAEELSAAAVTRGIENPARKTSAVSLRLSLLDFLGMLAGLALLVLSFVVQ